MQNKTFILSILIALTFLSGCAIKPHPQNAAEFRKALPGSMFGKKEVFYVKRKLKHVANSFKKMAGKCLRKRVKSVSSGYMHHQVIVTDYNPTVVKKKNRVELYLQQDHIQGVMNVTKKPKGGYYMLVTDAISAGKNKTKIEMYYASVGSDSIVKAIKGWAKGKKGCPDMTKL